MKQDKLDSLFKKLENDFDILEPKENHSARFLYKLNQHKNEQNKKSSFNWKPFLSIAASVVLFVSLFVVSTNDTKASELASVSPEMQQTQDFFTLTINEELKKLNAERNPETQELINDALAQIQQLETDYQSLKIDLSESGEDQRVIHAMISNFQNRIEILNTVLEQIENIKQLKNNSNENSITL